MKPVPHTPEEARRSHLESAFWRRTLLWGLRNVPPSVQRASMPLWASVFYLQVPHIRRAIDQNLDRLVKLRPSRRKLLAFRTFTNYCRCIANAYSLHAGAPLSVPTQVVGLDALREVLARGSGVVLATGHLGNWHIGPYLLAEHGLPPVTVVMSQEPDAAAQRLEAALRDQRQRIIYPGQDPLASLELRAALARGELVGLQLDRPTAGGGLRITTELGEATFALGPALLARTCQVPVVPVFFPLEGRGVRILIHPPLWSQRTRDRQADLEELTRRLAEVYLQQLRRFPDQWFNFYDFWGPEPAR